MKQKPKQDWSAARQAMRQLNETLDRVEIQLDGGNPDNVFDQLFRKVKAKPATKP